MTQNTKQLIQETMESYYEYVRKIEGGCTTITHFLKANELNEGMQGIVDLSSGLLWLLEVEERLQELSYKIDSPLRQVASLFEKINEAIEVNNMEDVINLLEIDLRPLFGNAREWRFEKAVS